jgi:hypothetical protein
MRARRFPGIAFRGDDWNRRAWVIGTAFDVWELIQAIKDLGGAEKAVKESGLTPAPSAATPLGLPRKSSLAPQSATQGLRP